MIPIYTKPVPDDYPAGFDFGDPAFAGNPWTAPPSSGASVPTPETSVHPHSTPIDEQIYKSERRKRESPEWQLSIDTLISMQPYVKGERIERFKNCRNNAYFYRHVESGKVRVMSSACRDRACPFCAQARSAEVAEKISEWLAGRKHPRFLTLTLRSSNAPLAVQIDNIYKAFRRYRLMKGMSQFLRAGVWFFQVTWNNERKQWHPHLHCVIVGKWAKWEFLREQWRIASKGSHVIDIEPIKEPKKTADYVARYSARPYRMAGLDLDQRQECIEAFASRRLFGTWGPKAEKPCVKREKLDFGLWEPIGSYAYVHYANHFDINARLIMDAWIKGEPLGEGVNCRAFSYSEACGFFERFFQPENSDFFGQKPGRSSDDGNESRKHKRKRHKIFVDSEQCLF